MDKRLIDEIVENYAAEEDDHWGTESIENPHADAIDAALNFFQMTEKQFIMFYANQSPAPAVCTNCHNIDFREAVTTYENCDSCGLEHSVSSVLVLLDQE